MTPRIDYYKAAPKVRDAMMAVELASRETSVPLTVRELLLPETLTSSSWPQRNCLAQKWYVWCTCLGYRR